MGNLTRPRPRAVVHLPGTHRWQYCPAMPEHAPHHRPVTVEDLIDDAIQPVLGDRLEDFYAEAERHDREVRAVAERVREQMQVEFQAVLNGRTGEPEESRFDVTAEMDVLLIRTHEAVRQALKAEHARHLRTVEELLAAKSGV